MIKKLFFPLFSIVLLYWSLEMTLNLIHSNPSDFSFLEFAILAFLLNIYLTGIFAFIGFAYPSSNLLPKSYYRIKNPKNIRICYQWLGIKYFRKVLLVFFWGTKKNRKKFFDGSRSGISGFLYESKQAEFGHIGAFVILLFLGILFLIKGYYKLVLLMTLINVVGNFYPVILQRYHRIRIEKLQLPMPILFRLINKFKLQAK